MPRSKEESHKRVLEAARSEFILKGYKDASMRSIGDKALMTQAGLYRHYKNKEEMYDDVLKPLLDHIKVLYEEHMTNSYKMIDTRDISELFKSNNVTIIKDLVLNYYDEFRLLLLGSNGTKYENFIHDLVNFETKEMLEAFDYLRSEGYEIREIEEDELHCLLSAYDTAILEPIVHGFSIERINKVLDRIEEFFIPAWSNLMGFKN